MIERAQDRPGAPLRVLAWPRTMQPDDNPYVDLLYEALDDTGDVEVVGFARRELLDRRWDIVHFHWPEWAVRVDSLPHSLVDIAKFTVLLSVARLRGARLVWTAHDLRPHEASRSPAMGRWMQVFSRQVDHVICLTSSTVAPVVAAYPGLLSAPVTVVPHGHYRSVLATGVLDAATARQHLGLPCGGRMLLLFGHLRPYKNAPELVRCFRSAADDGDSLVIAGRPLDAALADEVRAAAGGDPRVVLRLGAVLDEDVAAYVRSSDVVVLPYRSILNSGAALLALSCDRPVVAPSLGSFVELAGAVGPEWVRLYDGDLTDEIITAALRMPAPGGQAPLDRLEWDGLAKLTLGAYRQARRRRLRLPSSSRRRPAV